jgi:hypothetical protein
MRTLVRLFIRAYQLAVSPLIGPACRFYPSCSQYALEAVERFVALRRLGRCHPFHPGGFDPVPPAPSHPLHPHHAHDR